MLTFAPLYGLVGLLTGGYYALWQNELLSSGFQLPQLATLITAQIVISTIVDIPSSILADRLGHKTITNLGFLIYVIAFAIPLWQLSTPSLIATILLAGVADATINGALESWATELQVEREAEIRSKRFVERDQFMRIGMIAGALLVPLVVSLIPTIKTVAWGSFFLISLSLLAVGIMTPKAQRERPHESLSVRFGTRSLATLLSDRHLVGLLVGIVIFGMSDGVVSTVFWPRVRGFGFNNPALFGVIQMCMSLARVTGLHFWKKVPWIESRLLPGASILLSSVFFMLFGMTNNPYMAALAWITRIMVLSIYFSTIQALLVKWRNAATMRATILSVAGVLAAVGSAISTGLIGAFAHADDIASTCVAGAALAFIGGVVITTFSNERLNLRLDEKYR